MRAPAKYTVYFDVRKNTGHTLRGKWNNFWIYFRVRKNIRPTLARVVMGTCRRDHISPVLADLHWLPIRARLTYKIATLVFKVREVKQPMYLAELIEDYKPSRELHQTSRLLLKEPCLKTTTGQRSFQFAAAKIWNELPDYIRSVDSFDTFRKHLKTHLYILSYCG